MKQAGFDGLILFGKSDRPVILIVNEGSVSFRDAADLWGQSATATLVHLNQELGPDFRLLAIGPAGEAGVRFAGIVSDVRRTTARGGAGAVMGSKNLKAIAVRGSLPVPVQNASGLISLRRELATLLANWSNYTHWRRWAPPTPLLLSSSQAGMLTTKNYREGSWPAIANMAFPTAEHEFWVRHAACAHCSLKCVKTGRFQRSMARNHRRRARLQRWLDAYGANCGVTDFNGLMKLISRVDELGLDPIAAGNVLRIMDLYENGILRREDLDGLTPTWGNVPIMLELLDRIARRQGIGELLSLGVKKAAAAIEDRRSSLRHACKGAGTGWLECSGQS